MSVIHSPSGPAIGAEALAPAPTPKPIVRLYTERLFVDGQSFAGKRNERTSRPTEDHHERDVAVIALSFAYGTTRLRVTDEQESFFVSGARGLERVARNRKFERQAQCILESFGAVELGCLSTHVGESNADYLVHISDNVHALCSFSAYAIPQLEKLGWQVEVAAGYPYRVVATDTPWYANVQEDEENDNWFSLELGLDVDGQRINLLAGLLEMLNESSDSESLESILRTPTRFRAIPIDGSRYAVLPPERLRRLLYVLEELYSGSRDKTTFKESDLPVIGGITDAFEDEQQKLRWSGTISAVDKARKLASESPPEIRPATGLQATLRPYQQEGLNWLQNLIDNSVGGVLADDMGLGKTLQTISHLATEKERGRMSEPALVIVPKSLIGNWQREIKKFAPFLRVLAIQGSKRQELYPKMTRAHVVITTYPVLLRDLERFLEVHFHLVILDEAQAIKNCRSQAHAAVSSIRSTHRLCLTGTPVENNLGELWSLFHFLMPGFLGDAQTFRNRYQLPIEKDRNEVRLIQLRHRVAPFILRRMKDTVAKDLPPKTELVRPVELDGDQRDLYESIRVAAHDEVRQVIRKKGLSGSTIPILDALMKLRQACCDPRLINSPAARAVKTSSKYEFLMELLETQLAQGHRILIFSQFTRMLGLIGQGLTERRFPYILLTGQTADRQAKCDEFESGKADVFLISLKAGGTGLNLTSADTVIHYDPWWNPAAQAQATDRAYRIGQKRPVFVYNLIVAGSVEERMLRLQQLKRHLADTILGQGAAAHALSEADVEELFQPLD
jgi:SNF2 family DNA or RNA helicase